LALFYILPKAHYLIFTLSFLDLLGRSIYIYTYIYALYLGGQEREREGERGSDERGGRERFGLGREGRER
jgi:hypothetical protein